MFVRDSLVHNYPLSVCCQKCDVDFSDNEDIWLTTVLFPEVLYVFSPTECIHPLTHSTREFFLFFSSSPGLVHILCHFSSAKILSWIGSLGSLNCPSCSVTCLCFFGYSCLFWRLRSISGLPVWVLSSNLSVRFSCCLRKAGRHCRDLSFEPQVRNKLWSFLL